jgi:hypothetical protein
MDKTVNHLLKSGGAEVFLRFYIIQNPLELAYIIHRLTDVIRF